jgi:hypothetical protein
MDPRRYMANGKAGRFVRAARREWADGRSGPTSSGRLLLLNTGVPGCRQAPSAVSSGSTMEHETTLVASAP